MFGRVRKIEDVIFKRYTMQFVGRKGKALFDSAKFEKFEAVDCLESLLLIGYKKNEVVKVRFRLKPELRSMFLKEYGRTESFVSKYGALVLGGRYKYNRVT